ncbi:MAG: NAD(+) synthase [Propionibacteriaceae bacterium]|nr:NAD(+) synthase [Propionibacteriaceae bacterium]
MVTISERLAVPDPEYLADRLSAFIATTVHQRGRAGCVLGNSGGIDSALVATLAVRALGKKNVKLFFLPERDTHPKSRGDARLVARHLGLSMQEINMTPIIRKMGVYHLEPPSAVFPHFIRSIYAVLNWRRHSTKNTGYYLQMMRGGNSAKIRRDLAFSNAKNRARMSMLYKQADIQDCLVLGTDNRSETMTGLFVRYGDGASDLAPLAQLYKSQVFALAAYLGVPSRIIAKKPVGDLAPGVTDEHTLTMPYSQLDPILAGLELGLADQEILAQTDATQNQINYMKELMSLAQPMHEPPAVPSEADLFRRVEVSS